MKNVNRFNLFEAPYRGVNLVESSAGTGKTYNISGLVVRFLAEGIIDHPEKILVVTFTKAATRELRERIRTRIREGAAVLSGDADPQGDAFLEELLQRCANRTESAERLRRALSEMDKASIFTIHGFCQLALQEFVFESNSSFEITYTGDDAELREEAADDVWRRQLMRLDDDSEGTRFLLQLLLRRIKSPDDFLRMIQPAAGKPYLSFMMKNPDDILRTGLEEYAAAVKKMCDTFDREEIIKLLDSDVMKRNSFKPEAIPGWLDGFQSQMKAGFMINNDDKKAPFLKCAQVNVADKTKKGNPVPTHPFFEAVEDFTTLDLEELAESFFIGLFRDFQQRFTELKEQRGLRNYDDMLISMQEAVEENQEMRMRLREKYPVALVDEFQDTDPVQLAVFRELYFPSTEKNCLYLIGDPKQSIYKFRGADIFSYQKAAQNKDVRTFTLGKNFRSSKAMVDAVNAIFSWQNEGEPWPSGVRFMASEAHKNEQRFHLEGDEQEKKTMQFLLPDSVEKTTKTESTRFVMRQAAAEISRLLQKGSSGKAGFIRGEEFVPLKPGHIAALVKSHNEASILKKELLSLNVKSVHKSTKSVFKSEETQFILHLLNLIRERGNPALMRGFLFDKRLGFRMSELMELEDDAEANSEITELFALLGRTLHKDGFSVMLRRFLNSKLSRLKGKEVRVVERLLAFPDGERMYTNLMHINELMDEHERRSRPGLDELIKWLTTKKNESGDSEETEMRLDSDDDLVQIMTVHSSKGLEFPVVFCTSLWALKWAGPKKTPENAKVFHENGETKAAFSDWSKTSLAPLLDEEELGEHLRLIYVALTRAADRCYISVPYYPDKSFKTGAIRYLLDGYDSVKKSSAKLDAEGIKQSIKRFVSAHPQLAAVCTPDSAEPWSGVSQEVRESFSVRSLSRSLPDVSDWYLTSYSSVKSRAEHASVANFESDPTGDHIPEGESESKKDQISQAGFESIMNFPRGARAGTSMHRLFEELDFPAYKERAPQLIRETLAQDGFDPQWEHVLLNMLESVLCKKLPYSDARLADIPAERRRAEMEFYFTLKAAGYYELLGIIQGEKITSVPEPSTGFMNGFIDLVFEHNGRFYIADYKSDMIGTDKSDYQPENLKKVMDERGYSLQYHIYTVALMRFLKTKLGDAFDYDTHIGGSYYLFLRGITGDSGHGGIFFDRPERVLTERLDTYFTGG